MDDVTAAPRADTAPHGRARRGSILAWGLWDWGSAAFNTVAATFVFTVYLTSTPEFGRSKDVSSALGLALGAAGIVVLVLAPALGRRTDGGSSRRAWLAVTTAIIIACLVGLFFVTPGHAQLVLGLALIAIGTVVYEIAAVNYNAILRQVSTPRTVGTVSAFGWGMGFLGGIVLLLIVFVAFIQPETGFFGVTGENGLSVRVAMLVAAAWFAVFAIPVLLLVPDAPKGDRAHVGLIESYRLLLRDIARLWREDRDILRFMIASAVFRDGLTGVFTFAGVLAARSFGFTAGEVILFGIAANVIAGVVTIATGRLDDVLGPKTMIVVSLVGLLISGAFLIGLNALGSWVFWTFGLLFAVFIGPAQTSSRSFLSRMIPEGREGEIFGLYATTGRAATFLAPVLFSVFVAIGGAQIWGAVGILIPVLVGLVLLVPVPGPMRRMSGA